MEEASQHQAAGLTERTTGLLESSEAKALALLVGVLAGIARLFSYALPKLVSPLATSALVIVGLYLIWLAYRYYRRKRNQSEADRVFAYMSKRYGVAYPSLQVECIIRSDGSAEVRRKVQAMAHSEIARLDTALVIPDKRANGTQWQDIDLIDVASLTAGRDVSLLPSRTQDGKQSAVIAISPRLVDGQQVTYQMIQRLPPGLYAIGLTVAELEKRTTPDDYFGWTINRPTKRFRLSVFYPEGVKPSVYDFAVRYASAAPGIASEFAQYEEQKRFKPSLKGPEGGHYCLSLEIDYPMIGLVYILSWRPIPRLA